MSLVRLYNYPSSGNCYKVRLLLSQLEIPFEQVQLDIEKGETRTPEYLAKNPNRKVPLVEWPDGRRLAESGAILSFFGEGTELLPESKWDRANVLQWIFFEQYSHEPYIAVVRHWHHVPGLLEKNRAALAEKTERGYHALGVMEQHLASRRFFVGERYSIADIALYAYTHVAEEGGFELKGYPKIGAWLEAVRSQPGHVKITDPVGVPVRWP